MADIDELSKQVNDFCDVRDWGQSHNPKDLAIATTLEAAELLEPFRYQTKEDVEAIIKDKKGDIEDELADILFVVFRFSKLYNVDLEAALKRKLKKTGEKYPLELAKP